MKRLMFVLLIFALFSNYYVVASPRHGNYPFDKPNEISKAISLGFVESCVDGKSNTVVTRETARVISNPSQGWCIVEEFCDKLDPRYDSFHQFWIKGQRDRSFRMMADASRKGSISANDKGDWLLYRTSPVSGESSAMLLPMSAFLGQGIKKAKYHFMSTDFLNIDPVGCIDLGAEFASKVPRNFEGRRTLGASWKGSDIVQVDIEAKTGQEPDGHPIWEGSFEYSIRDKKILPASVRNTR